MHTAQGVYISVIITPRQAYGPQMGGGWASTQNITVLAT